MSFGGFGDWSFGALRERDVPLDLIFWRDRRRRAAVCRYRAADQAPRGEIARLAAPPRRSAHLPEPSLVES